MIAKPCVIEDMDDATYHGDPVKGGSLSSSGAKDLLRSPAHYQHARTHRVEKAAYDVGHAVHATVLGVGMDVVVIDHDSYRTAAAKAERDEAYAAGKTPLLAKDYEPVEAMARAVLSHPDARAVFERSGAPEASAFAPDPETGVWMRARPDFLPDHNGRRTIIGDLKTAVSADPRDFDRTAADYGYDIQAEWYQRVVRLARGDDDTAFVFVIVEKAPPYLVSVVELTGDFRITGRSRMERALRTYRQCVESDEWPGYARGIHAVEPPRWHVINEEMENTP